MQSPMQPTCAERNMESSIYPSLPVEMHALGAGFYRTAAANALDVQEDPDEGNAALTLSGQVSIEAVLEAVRGPTYLP